MINGSARYISNTLTTIVINPNSNWDYEIAPGAFLNLKNVTSITTPADECSSTIPNRAFEGCSSLTTIGGTLLADTYDGIGDSAFEGCSSLTSFKLTGKKSGEFYIGDSAFIGCNALESFETESNIYSIGDLAFAEDAALTSFKVTAAYTSAGINTIHDLAFYSCTALTSFSVSNNDVYKICDNAFEDCTSLEEFKLTYIDTTIGAYAFNGCTSLTTFDVKYIGGTFTNGDITIGAYAFGGCTALTKIVIPTTVRTVGQNIFNGCKNLVNITMPHIGKDRMGGSLTTSSSDYNIGYWFGNSTATGTSTTTFVTSSGTKLNYILPNANMTIHLTRVRTIPAYALAVTNYPYKISLYIDGVDNINGNTTYAIGDMAFAKFNSSDLTSITSTTSYFTLGSFINGCTSIGQHAFRGCLYVLYNIRGSLPTTLTTIGAYAFYNNYVSVAELTIPDSVTSVAYAAFAGCTNIGKLNLGKNAVLSDVVFKGTQFTTCYYNGTVAELANVMKKWSAVWSKDSSLTSITCTDNTYVI